MNSQLVQSRFQFLNYIGPNFSLLVTTLEADSLQNPRSESEVVNSPAGTQGSGNDGGLGNQIHRTQVGHSLSDFPSVDISPVEVSLVSSVELCVRFHHFGAHHSHGGRADCGSH